MSEVQTNIHWASIVDRIAPGRVIRSMLLAPCRLCGMGPLEVYRLSAKMHSLGWRRTARLLKAVNYFAFRAIIPPEMKAGEKLRFGHYALNVVIHPSVEVGDDVFIHQNVTLATDVNPAVGPCMRIGSRVTIGTGAIILGPITVGDDVFIGAGAVVKNDIPSGQIVAGVPARPIKSKSDTR